MKPRKQKSQSVKQLANNANMDLDDALVTLWEAGLDHLMNPTDHVKSNELNIAQNALGLATKKVTVTF